MSSAAAPQPLMVVPSAVKSMVPLVTGVAGLPLVTAARKVTPWSGLAVKEGSGLPVTDVVVAASEPRVKVRLQPPLIWPAPSAAPSVTTYRLQVPLGLVPLNWSPRVEVPLGAGVP